MKKFRSPDQWRQILEDQQQSGLTISEFCRQQKISVSCFFSQRKKLGLANTATSAFVSTKVTKQTSTEVQRDVKQPIVLELSAARLTLPAETPAGYMLTLLNVLTPFDYIMHCLEHLAASPDNVEDLLPWNVKLGKV